jgi:carbamate kinase
MLLVIAIGGNALVNHNEAPTAENQLRNIKVAAAQIAQLSEKYDLVITHGNGPQVGLLALQNEAYRCATPYPMDILIAQTQGQIGFMLAQEISNCMPNRRSLSSTKKTVAAVLTRVEIDKNDVAFERPENPIGPMYTTAEVQKLRSNKNWQFAIHGTGYRRVVASPEPKKILEMQTIKSLLDNLTIVICAGGGGIPVEVHSHSKTYHGVEAVIDKDATACLLAIELKADALIIATNVSHVFSDWGTKNQKPILNTWPDELNKTAFTSDSMAPKVKACSKFTQETGKPSYIGELARLSSLMEPEASTKIAMEHARLRLLSDSNKPLKRASSRLSRTQ